MISLPQLLHWISMIANLSALHGAANTKATCSMWPIVKWVPWLADSAQHTYYFGMLATQHNCNGMCQVK